MDAFPLYNAAQARALDRLATEQLGVASFELMSRAGRAAFRVLRERYPLAQQIVVACGPGNNGGDGYVLARLFREAGREVRVFSLDGRIPQDGDGGRAARAWLEAGGRIDLLANALPAADLLIDALFGIGLSRDLTSSAAAAVHAINTAPATRIALDLPSGLCSDTGRIRGCAVQAALTISFIAHKLGLWTAQGRRVAGEICLEKLELPASLLAQVAPCADALGVDYLRTELPPRPADSHKNSFGHVLVLGGDLGYGGAVRLAAESALRSGAGLVTVATRGEHVAPILAARPELMVRVVQTASDLRPLLKRADVFLAGPGLGLAPWGQALLQAGVEANLPTVMDADALTLLADGACLLPERLIITPHPGEAARLLECTGAQVQSDRLSAVLRLAEAFECTAVLKGSGTLIASRGQRSALCPFGNAGLATAGTGDVLAGLLASLWAQGMPAFAAACAGVLAHARAGDELARLGQRGLLAGDLCLAMRSSLNPAR